MTIDRLMAIRKNEAEWSQSGYAQLCREGEDEGFVVLSCLYSARICLPETEIVGVVLFMQVEPGCDTVEPAYEAVVFVEGKYFFGDGVTPLRVVWKEN